MSDDAADDPLRNPILRYLTPAPDGFWRWSEDPEAVEWTDPAGHGTIAFASELAALLAASGEMDLPPIESLLLLLLGCGESWKPETLLTQLGPALGAAQCWPSDVEALGTSLARIKSLPRDRRIRGARALLLRVLLQNVPPSRQKLAGFYAEGLREQLRGQRVRLSESPRLVNRLFAAVRWFNEAVATLEDVDLDLRDQTGLDAIPEPLEAEPEEPSHADAPPLRSRLSDWLADPELAPLARVARDLAATLTLPRRLAHDDGPDAGGVSDLSNRGQVDRLLLSELAHDGDVLTARVALGQALYLRRETPPTVPPEDRLLLIDTGLRTWGTPRLLIAAAAIALSDEDDTRAMRIEGDRLTEVDLLTREGVVGLLGSLDAREHPADAIAALAKANAIADQTRCVLLTTDQTAADERTDAALRDARLDDMVVVAVSREGRVELRERTRFGDRTLRSIALDLDRLLGPPTPNAKSLRDTAADLPSVLATEPFPLPVPYVPTGENAFGFLDPPFTPDNRTLWVVTHDRRLLELDHIRTVDLDVDNADPDGGRSGIGRAMHELTAHLPLGEIMLGEPRLPGSGGATEREPLLVLAGETGYPVLIRREWIRGDRRMPGRKLIGGGGRPIGVAAISPHHLAVIRSGSADAYAIADASHVQSLLVPGSMQWRGSRYFASADGWRQLIFSDGSLRFETVIAPKLAAPDTVHAVHDLASHDPAVPPRRVAVLKTGDVLDLTHERTDRMPRRLRRDIGLDTVARSFPSPWRHTVHLRGRDRRDRLGERSVVFHSSNTGNAIWQTSPAESQAALRPLPNAAEAMSIEGVASHAGQPVLLTLDDGGPRIVALAFARSTKGRFLVVESVGSPDSIAWIRPPKTAGPDSGGVAVRRIETERAIVWFDSRGYVHVRSRETGEEASIGLEIDDDLGDQTHQDGRSEIRFLARTPDGTLATAFDGSPHLPAPQADSLWQMLTEALADRPPMSTALVRRASETNL